MDSILDKENFTLEELLDEDEIIQECKSLNSRLINFLRQRDQLEQLLRFIVEESPEDSEKKRSFKFPFIACEIFTCEVDSILSALVEDEELMNLLFSFLHPDHSHNTLLAGYFSKVVICLMLRKPVSFMAYVQNHPEIFKQLVDLIGITSIMEVLVRLIGADGHMHNSHPDAMQWLEEVNVLEMIVDKFSCSDSPEVHANASETLCAITRYAPSELVAKISSPSFVGRLFGYALEDSRPKSVLLYSLTVCISLLDPKRLVQSSYHLFPGQLAQVSAVVANSETVSAMLERLGDLLKLLDISSPDNVLPTTYGCLCPPLGKLRLKIVEFISVLLTVGNESAEKEMIHLGAVQRIIDLLFEYPFNNFLHHHIEEIIGSCLESKRTLLVEHILRDCKIVEKIIRAEKHSMLDKDMNEKTIPAEGKSPPRIGNIGHISRIANKLLQVGNFNDIIQAHLQETEEWVDWYKHVLQNRNAIENVYGWNCGRPNSLQDRTRDSDDEDFKARDYDVAAFANNMSHAFQFHSYGNDDIEEDVYFDDESAEVVISSLRLGDDQESSLFTNSNWFAFEDNRPVNESSSVSISSPASRDETDEVMVGESDVSSTPSEVPKSTFSTGKSTNPFIENGPIMEAQDDYGHFNSVSDVKNPSEWVELRESSNSSMVESSVIPNGDQNEVSSVPTVKAADMHIEMNAMNDEPAGPSSHSTTEPSDGEQTADKHQTAPDFSCEDLDAKSCDPDMVGDGASLMDATPSDCSREENDGN